MKTLEELIAELSEQELQEGFQAIVQWRNTGNIPDGIIKEVHRRFEEMIRTQYSVYGLETAFLFEMARRKYAG